MRWNSFHGLRGRLLLLVSLAMLPGVVLTAFGAWHAEHVAEREAQRGLLDSLASMQQSFVRELDRAGPDLQLAASKPLDQPAACHAMLSIVLAQDPNYSQAGIVTPDGESLCSMIRPGAVAVRIEPSWVQGAMRKNGRALAMVPDPQGQNSPQLRVAGPQAGWCWTASGLRDLRSLQSGHGAGFSRGGDSRRGQAATAR
ncbi:MAG: hypothetical protein WC617_06655 [Rhodanobacter sp.]|jgi:hypothetical protein